MSFRKIRILPRSSGRSSEVKVTRGASEVLSTDFHSNRRPPYLSPHIFPSFQEKRGQFKGVSVDQSPHTIAFSESQIIPEEISENVFLTWPNNFIKLYLI